MVKIKNIFASGFWLQASSFRRTACSLQHVVFCFVLFLLFPLQGCYSQNQGEIIEEPKISDPYTWDFGQAGEGEILRHNFILKNDSEAVLNIKDVNASCGCTVPKVEKKRLLPGEAALIEVEFNSKGYLGQTQQFVYVHTDDINNPILRFIIKAEIIKPKY